MLQLMEVDCTPDAEGARGYSEREHDAPRRIVAQPISPVCECSDDAALHHGAQADVRSDNR